MIDFYFSARGLPKIVKDNGHLEQKPALVIGDELYEYERIFSEIYKTAKLHTLKLEL